MDELVEHFSKAPYPLQCLYHGLKIGIKDLEDCRLLRLLNTNPSQRGIPALMEMEQKLLDDVHNVNLMEGMGIRTYTYGEVVKLFPGEEADNIVRKAGDIGIFPDYAFVRSALRGNLFQKLLLEGTQMESMFNSRPLVVTFHDKIWQRLYEKYGDLGPPKWSEITSKDIRALGMTLGTMVFIDTRQKILTWVSDEEGLVEVTPVEACQMSTMSLKIGTGFLKLDPID
jgi:hypothetical protein